MSDVFPKQKLPNRPHSKRLKEQRRDYKRKRDRSGRFASTERSVSSRRYMRALARKSSQKRQRKTSSNIYTERGGLKSQKAIKASQRRGTAKRSKARSKR